MSAFPVFTAFLTFTALSVSVRMSFAKGRQHFCFSLSFDASPNLRVRETCTVDIMFLSSVFLYNTRSLEYHLRTFTHHHTTSLFKDILRLVAQLLITLNDVILSTHTLTSAAPPFTPHHIEPLCTTSHDTKQHYRTQHHVTLLLDTLNHHHDALPHHFEPRCTFSFLFLLFSSLSLSLSLPVFSLPSPHSPYFPSCHIASFFPLNIYTEHVF